MIKDKKSPRSKLTEAKTNKLKHQNLLALKNVTGTGASSWALCKNTDYLKMLITFPLFHYSHSLIIKESNA